MKKSLLSSRPAETSAGFWTGTLVLGIASLALGGIAVFYAGYNIARLLAAGGAWTFSFWFWCAAMTLGACLLACPAMMSAAFLRWAAMIRYSRMQEERGRTKAGAADLDMYIRVAAEQDAKARSEIAAQMKSGNDDMVKLMDRKLSDQQAALAGRIDELQRSSEARTEAQKAGFEKQIKMEMLNMLRSLGSSIDRIDEKMRVIGAAKAEDEENLRRMKEDAGEENAEIEESEAAPEPPEPAEAVRRAAGQAPAHVSQVPADPEGQPDPAESMKAPEAGGSPLRQRKASRRKPKAAPPEPEAAEGAESLFSDEDLAMAPAEDDDSPGAGSVSGSIRY